MPFQILTPWKGGGTTQIFFKILTKKWEVLNPFSKYLLPCAKRRKFLDPYLCCNPENSRWDSNPLPLFRWKILENLTHIKSVWERGLFAYIWILTQYSVLLATLAWIYKITGCSITRNYHFFRLFFSKHCQKNASKCWQWWFNYNLSVFTHCFTCCLHLCNNWTSW